MKATLEEEVVKNDKIPNLGDEGVVIKANCDVDESHVILAKCDDDGDWVFDYVHSYHICKDKKLVYISNYVVRLVVRKKNLHPLVPTIKHCYRQIQKACLQG